MTISHETQEQERYKVNVIVTAYWMILNETYSPEGFTALVLTLLSNPFSLLVVSGWPMSPPTSRKCMSTLVLGITGSLQKRLRSYCMRVGPTPMTGVPVRGGRLATERYTWCQRQRLEWCTYKPRKAKNVQQQRLGGGKEGYFPRAFGRNGPCWHLDFRHAASELQMRTSVLF